MTIALKCNIVHEIKKDVAEADYLVSVTAHGCDVEARASRQRTGRGVAWWQQSALRDPRTDKRGGVIVPGDIGSRYGGGHGHRTGVGRNEAGSQDRRDISPKRRINKL